MQNSNETFTRRVTKLYLRSTISYAVVRTKLQIEIRYNEKDIIPETMFAA